MAQFTDSPYEYMMSQKPSAGQERGKGPPEPPAYGCGSCPYGRARPCIGFCIKKLLSEVRKERRSHETDKTDT